MTKLGPFDLELVREFNAPVELVWEVWTTPAHLKNWYVPKPVELTQCEIDLKVGGQFFTNMKLPDGMEMPGASVYLDVVPNERLVFTDCLTPDWHPSAEPFMTAVLAFEAIEGGTRQTAWALHSSEENKLRHEEMGFYDGWGTTADQMAALLAELQA